MTKAVANVDISTDSFAGWLAKTNILLDALTNEVVTINAGAGGSNTTGNGSVIGTFSANTLGALVVRGGGVGNSANISTLTIGLANSTTSSNVVITGYAANVIANTLNASSNVSLTGANISVVTANVAIGGGRLNVTSNVHLSGANTTIDNLLTVTDVKATGNIYANASIIFTGNTSAIVQTSGDFAFPGDGTTSNVVSYFAIGSYKSAKYTVSVSDNDNVDSRIQTEISAVYNSSNVYSTEYGTIFTNTKFMTFTLGANSTHVYLEGTSNTSVVNANVTVIRTSFS